LSQTCQAKNRDCYLKNGRMLYNGLMENDFVTWLTSELDRRGWSNSELARRSDMVPSTISMVISERNAPSVEFCVKVARAFGLYDVDVLRKAGLIDPVPAAVAREEEVIRLFRQVPDTHRDLAIRVLDVFAHAAPAPGADPNEWANLAPGESVILRTWGADHPLIQLFESLRTASGEEAVAWLLEHVMRFGTTAATATEEERKSPAIETARR